MNVKLSGGKTTIYNSKVSTIFSKRVAVVCWVQTAIHALRPSPNGSCNPLVTKVGQLNRVRHSLRQKDMITIADGIVNSAVRYCLPVYGAEFLRLREDDPQHQLPHRIQVKMNDALRIITGNRLRDKIKISDMLQTTNMLSLNQMLAYSILMETWKIRKLRIESISDCWTQPSRSSRASSRGEIIPVVQDPYVQNAAKLWNSTSDRFKNTELIAVAKKEARILVKTLPI